MTCFPPPSAPSDFVESPSIPWLFDDLITEILAYHSKDRRTLAACTLVSRAWLPLASRHIFRSVRFPGLRPPRSLDPACPSTVDDFLCFVTSYERAKSSLQKLSLRSSYDAQRTSPFHVSFSTLRELVAALPRLRVLKLGQGNRLLILNDMPTDEGELRPRLALNKLVIGDVIGSEDEHILDLLGLFSPVDELVFEPSPGYAAGCALMLAQDDLAKYATTMKIEVNSLSFRFWLHDELQLRFLLTIGTALAPASLKHITNVSLSHFGDLAQLDKFICDVATHLEELTLRIYSPGVNLGFQPRLARSMTQGPPFRSYLRSQIPFSVDTDAPKGQISGLPALTKCSALRQMTIYVDIWPWRDSTLVRNTLHSTDNTSSFNAALAILEPALATPALRTADLVFFLRYHPLTIPRSLITPENVLARMQELHWEQMDDMNIRNDGLKAITIKLDRNEQGDGDPWLVDELKKLLDSRLKSRVTELVRYM